jgi:hypothetical protein
VAALPFGWLPLAYADHIDLDKVEITAVKPGVPDNAPNSVESVTKTQIEESGNTVTTAGALQYLPSMHKRQCMPMDYYYQTS